MPKIRVTFMTNTKVQIEAGDEASAALFREKLQKEITEDEAHGLSEGKLDVTCAVKRWLFDGTPCKIEIDVEGETGVVLPMTEPDNKWEEWKEAFSIFARYSKDGEICSGHDQVWGGVELKEIDPKDEKRLEELGWRRASEGGFTKYTS